MGRIGAVLFSAALLAGSMIPLSSLPASATGPTIYRPPTNTDGLARQQQDIRRFQNDLTNRNRQEFKANRKAQADRQKRDTELKYKFCRGRGIDKKDDCKR